MSEPEFQYSNRGFKHLKEFEDSYGAEIRVYESSAAMSPHLWLKLTQGPSIDSKLGEVSAHLSFEQAEELIAQLQWLMSNHYQLT